MAEKVAIFGIGNYAEVMIELCEEVGHEITGLYHFNSSRTGEKVMGYEIEGNYVDFMNQEKGGGKSVVIAIGDNRIRNEWLNKMRNLGFNTISVIHPTAFISKSAKIGSGVYVHARAYVWTKTVISNNVIISPNAMVAHHSEIGEGCLISANSMVGSYTTLEEEVLVGINAGVISKNLVVGAKSVIGANAMVISDIAPKSVVIGTPAKEKGIRK